MTDRKAVADAIRKSMRINNPKSNPSDKDLKQYAKAVLGWVDMTSRLDYLRAHPGELTDLQLLYLLAARPDDVGNTTREALSILAK